jgi:hypothetical protein
LRLKEVRPRAEKKRIARKKKNLLTGPPGEKKKKLPKQKIPGKKITYLTKELSTSPSSRENPEASESTDLPAETSKFGSERPGAEGTEGSR